MGWLSQGMLSHVKSVHNCRCNLPDGADQVVRNALNGVGHGDADFASSRTNASSWSRNTGGRVSECEFWRCLDGSTS